MKIPLFDVSIGIGGVAYGTLESVSVDSWRAEMDRLDIQHALVHTFPVQLDRDPIYSNNTLYSFCQTDNRLYPCPVVIPNTAGDMPTEDDQVADAIQHQASAVIIRPTQDNWSLEPWGCDTLFSALEIRRMPVLCRLDFIDTAMLATLAARYPALPFIASGASYISQRTLAPLLQAHPNIHLAIGGRYGVHGGLEHLIASAGVNQILFGTGWPETEAMAAITYLLYSDLSDEQKHMIGSGNMKRLMEGIQL